MGPVASQGPSHAAEPGTGPEALARLVLRCRELEAYVVSVKGLLPSRADMPFLYRQLEDILRSLHTDLGALGLELGPEEEETSGLLRLLGKKKRRPERLAPAVGPRYDLQGNAWTVPVTELVDFLAHSGKSGVLWVTTPHETFVLEFARGNLVHATSDAPPAAFRLGEILVREAMLTPAELETEIANARAADDLLGSHLVRSGRLQAATLHRALAVQVQELFHRLMDAENATYGFQEGLHLLRAQGLEVNITQLLLESARKKDESRQRADDEARAALDLLEPEPEVEGDPPSSAAHAAAQDEKTSAERPSASDAPSARPEPAAPLPSSEGKDEPATASADKAESSPLPPLP